MYIPLGAQACCSKAISYAQTGCSTQKNGPSIWVEVRWGRTLLQVPSMQCRIPNKGWRVSRTMCNIHDNYFTGFAGKHCLASPSEGEGA